MKKLKISNEALKKAKEKLLNMSYSAILDKALKKRFGKT